MTFPRQARTPFPVLLFALLLEESDGTEFRRIGWDIFQTGAVQIYKAAFNNASISNEMFCMQQDK
jgi:hypothetical protein